MLPSKDKETRNAKSTKQTGPPPLLPSETFSVGGLGPAYPCSDSKITTADDINPALPGTRNIP